MNQIKKIMKTLVKRQDEMEQKCYKIDESEYKVNKLLVLSFTRLLLYHILDLGATLDSYCKVLLFVNETGISDTQLSVSILLARMH